MEAAWGKADWGVLAAGRKTIWEEMSLPARVRADPAATMPFVSLGAGSLHVTWKQETDLMKAYLETGNGFMAEFFWGGSAALPLPGGPFEPRTDTPILGCRSQSPLFPEFIEKQFETGERGYAGGSRLNTIPRWECDKIVDEPDRLEITIYAERQVTYAGKVKTDTTIRNRRRFRPQPGEKVRWVRQELENPPRRSEGEVRVGEGGRITIPALEFGEPARLILERADP
jgi:hypothetical protein